MVQHDFFIKLLCDAVTQRVPPLVSSPEASLVFICWLSGHQGAVRISVENSICKQLSSVVSGTNHNRFHFSLDTPAKFVLVIEHVPCVGAFI